MQMHPKYAIPLICWDMLGFYRGVESYDDGRATYGHGKYKYWDSFVCGIGGAFVYSIPPLISWGPFSHHDFNLNIILYPKTILN